MIAVRMIFNGVCYQSEGKHGTLKTETTGPGCRTSAAVN